MRRLAAILTLIALAGCAGAPRVTQDDLRYDTWRAEWRRTFQASYYEIPFEKGAVSVVAEEHGALRTYILVPCRGGAAICGEMLHGRAGSLTRTPDYVAISGAYAGRVFYLQPGGTGVLRRGGVTSPLAWE